MMGTHGCDVACGNWGRFRVIDGGLGSELASAQGLLAIDGDPLWSARLIKTNPDAISRVHDSFLLAGADIIATATYQASVEGFVEHLGCTPEDAISLFGTAVQLCREAIDRFWSAQSELIKNERVKPVVAGSLGAYGAHLHDGSEYTGAYCDNLSIEELVAWHRPHAQALLAAGVDLLAFETIPAQKEAEAIVQVLRELPSDCQAWISFSCLDGKRVCHGELFSSACRSIADCPQCIGVGINCTSPQNIEPLLESLQAEGVASNKIIVVYPNSGADWTAGDGAGWSDYRDRKSFCTEGDQLEKSVHRWIDLGARWIGGCCCITPDHIRLIRKAMYSHDVANS